MPLSEKNRAFTASLLSTAATLIVAIVFYVLISDEQANLAATVARTVKAERDATRALCNIRGSYDQQILASEQFLVNHPHGIPGIPAALIVKGIRDDRQRRDALADVNCP